MNIFLNLLSKFGVFLFFILLQVIALYLVVNKNELHANEFGQTQTAITGFFGEKINFVGRFFTLDEENKKLQKANARLENLLRNYQQSANGISDSILFNRDTLDKVFTYTYLPAKVVSNTIHKPDNFIILNKGAKDGIRKGMGVVSDAGIIGKVIHTSERYAAAQSILHRKFRLSAQIKGDDSFGTLTWDGVDPGIVQLKEISRYAPTNKGDTIETYGGRSIFPRFHPIGTIDTVRVDKQTNENKIDVKLFEPLTKLRYAYIIKNINAEEVRELEVVVDSINQIDANVE